MYATISDLLKDLFGFYIPLPIQTFGFFMAISFAFAYWVSSLELKRMEGDGLLKPIKQKQIKNAPVTIVDFVTSTVIGGFIGFKGLEMILDYDTLVLNPQEFLLSGKGSWFGALAAGAYAFYLKKKESEALKGKTQETVDVMVHPYELMGNIVALAAIGGLLGAKIFHNLENLDDFFKDPLGSLLSFSGLTFYGGLIVASASVIYYARKNDIPTLRLADAILPGVMLAYGVGRLGCHMSGDGDWGINNLAPKPEWMSIIPDWVWSYRYPHNVLNEGIPIPGCEGNHCNMLEFPVFPTPFYEAFAGVFLFFVLWSLRKRLKTPGMISSLFLIFNGTERFLVEKIRVNTTYHIFDKHITQAEIISATLFFSGLICLIYLVSKKNNKMA